jgi:hypothetical protein
VNPNDPKEQSSTPAPTVPVTIGQRFLDELKGGTSKNTAVSPLAKIIESERSKNTTEPRWIRIGAPLLLIIAAPVGILLTWLCWALIWETGVFVFGRHWKIVVAAVILYLVIMEVLERIRRRERK